MSDPDSYCIACEQPHTECVCAGKHRVKMFRHAEGSTLALLVVEAPNARQWARERGTIAGYEWYWEGSDFAYTRIEVGPDTVEGIRGEGYDLDTSDYDDPAP